jgi:trans-aconitate 2-methyltransferase
MNWDPNQYLAFADLRLRPALDLLGRVPVAAPGTVVDLGCGAGNVTRVLAERWPGAQITGIDGSPEMLAKARQTASVGGPDITWIECDIEDWRADVTVDVIYSNAVFHWLDHHETVFPGLLSMVAKGGALAVQMPSNPAAPFQYLMQDVAKGTEWWDALEPHFRPDPVAGPGFYYDLLAPTAARVEIWETTYSQVLTGENAVLEWVKGSRLRPLLAALAEPERSAYEAAYGKAVNEAYPAAPDGTTVLPFRRLFLIAVA